MLVLTPQVIDHCALKLMSFLLLSVASKVPSCLPLSLYFLPITVTQLPTATRQKIKCLSPHTPFYTVL